MSGYSAHQQCDASEVWPNLALKWQLIGPPLRPSPEDVDYYWSAISAGITGTRPPRVMILGVTPELYYLPWPKGTDILAVDHTQAMIDALWPGPPGSALCAEWPAIPAPPASRDIILCDGGVNMVAYPAEQSAVVASAARILVPGGLFVVRLFAPPARAESPDEVMDDLVEGRIENLNVFKLRIWAALQSRAEEGISVGDVWKATSGVAPDIGELAMRIGWPVDHARMLDEYRGKTSRYSLPMPEQIIELFCVRPGGFALTKRHTPSYAWGDRCPFLVLRRTEDGARRENS